MNINMKKYSTEPLTEQSTFYMKSTRRRDNRAYFCLAPIVIVAVGIVLPITHWKEHTISSKANWFRKVSSMRKKKQLSLYIRHLVVEAALYNAGYKIIRHLVDGYTLRIIVREGGAA